jgi:hypothetical protein
VGYPFIGAVAGVHGSMAINANLGVAGEATPQARLHFPPPAQPTNTAYDAVRERGMFWN